MDASDRRKRAVGEAAEWFVRLQGGEMERGERVQFVEWLKESHLHVAAMLRMAKIHNTLKHHNGWADISTGPKTDADKVVEFPPPPEGAPEIPQGPSHALRAPPSRTQSKGLGLRLFAFAAVVLLAVGAIVLLPRLRGQIIETERGERREVVLSDGSVLQVDPETRLRVKYTGPERTVFLDRGRALFHVSKNPTRPFLVHADDTTVRAVGTSFGVEQRAQGVIVTVAEGKVAVFPSSRAPDSPALASTPASITMPATNEMPATSEASAYDKNTTITSAPPALAVPKLATPKLKTAEAPEVFLSANQQVTVAGSGSAEPVREVDSRRALAWAEGRLIFQNDELRKAVAEFNRYNRVQLKLTDAELAEKPVSGVFNAVEPEAFIAFLQFVAPVEIVRDGERTITISLARPH